MYPNVITVLTEARNLLSDPKKWTRGGYVSARDAHGEPTTYDNPNAVQFCMVGAMFKVSDSIGKGYAGLYIGLDVIRNLIPASIAQFDESADHATMLAKFDEAIKFVNSGDPAMEYIASQVKELMD
jgi:hypothetical protein